MGRVIAFSEFAEYYKPLRERWVATALLEIEPRPNCVMGHDHLKELRAAMKRFIAGRRKQEIAA